MKWIYVFVALLAGALMPLQAGINMRLRLALESTTWAALVSFSVGTLVLFVVALVTRAPMPSLSMISSAPAWAWIGGSFGAFFVFATIILGAKLGAATMMAWLLAGQFLAALLLDHYGLVSFQVHLVSWPRVLGVVLLILGAVLVNRY